MENGFFENTELATRAEMRIEAKRRLSMLVNTYGLDSGICETWARGYISYSAASIHSEIAVSQNMSVHDLPPDLPLASVHHVPKHSALADIVHEFEAENNCVVYYILQNGLYLNFLYVDPFKEDWPLFDTEDILSGHFSSYIHNLFFGNRSGFGGIFLCSVNGILVMNN